MFLSDLFQKYLDKNKKLQSNKFYIIDGDQKIKLELDGAIFPAVMSNLGGFQLHTGVWMQSPHVILPSSGPSPPLSATGSTTPDSCHRGFHLKRLQLRIDLWPYSVHIHKLTETETRRFRYCLLQGSPTLLEPVSSRPKREQQSLTMCRNIHYIFVAIKAFTLYNLAFEYVQLLNTYSCIFFCIKFFLIYFPFNGSTFKFLSK